MHITLIVKYYGESIDDLEQIMFDTFGWCELNYMISKPSKKPRHDETHRLCVFTIHELNGNEMINNTRKVSNWDLVEELLDKIPDVEFVGKD